MMTAMILISTLALPVPAGAEVYKFVDENGVLNYTNIETPKNVE
jgi:hypothetical protein